jgi:hypothetical protein
MRGLSSCVSMPRKKRNSSDKKPAPNEQPGIDKETADRHVEGLIVRGEAAKAKDGELPPHATHEIVEEREGELPKVRRRRFSLF